MSKIIFMDNNLQTPPTVTPSPTGVPQQGVTPLPQTPPTKSGMGMTFAMIIAVVIIVLVLLMSGYLLLFHKTQTTHNAQVFKEPAAAVSPTATPVPPTYQINPQDTSDNAINQDTQATSQNLNNLNSDLNNVSQSFNDQQTNLQ
jgi:hypothetical protein